MKIIIKTYTGTNPEIAQFFQDDADKMYADGHHIVSQSWARDRWGVLTVFVLAVLTVITFGIAGPWFVNMFVDPPSGTLTVAYGK